MSGLEARNSDVDAGGTPLLQARTLPAAEVRCPCRFIHFPFSIQGGSYLEIIAISNAATADFVFIRRMSTSSTSASAWICFADGVVFPA